ncbi:hypothetical protein PG991_000778 [Apiospora marii]|uniref:Uncharacterized protein n=1 Tax=Apiospora marii TaxID=335849 RepID=A0ABR1ST95_9PEZI
MAPEKMEQLEAVNWDKGTAEQIVLLKSPVASLSSGDKKTGKQGGPYNIDPIPQIGQESTAKVSTDFSLETRYRLRSLRVVL